jgi:Zn-dependent protease with chaperone function
VIAALSLLVYAIVVAAAGQRVLARFIDRAVPPLLGVFAWYMACVWVVSATAAAAMLAADLHPHHGFAGLLDACLEMAGHAREHPHLLAAPVALAALGVAIARWVWAAAICTGADLRLRHRHLDTIRLVAYPDSVRGIQVVDAGDTAVYCLAGRRPTIVATTAAMGVLTGRQLDAVLEHERCHLRERHHLLIRVIRISARAFPFVPVFAAARAYIPALLELRADDVAAHRHGSHTVAGALAALAASPPATALGAGGPTALARAHRLLAADADPGMPWRLLGGLAPIALGPLVALVVPFCW